MPGNEGSFISRREAVMGKILRTMGLLLAVLPMACVDDHSNMGPVSSLEAVYKLALEGKIQETKEYFSDDLLKFLETNPDWTLEKVWQNRLQNGLVGGIAVMEKSADKTKARMKFMIARTDGSAGEEGEESMVFEKGMWKFDKIDRIR
jgi:hypothetical protein